MLTTLTGLCKQSRFCVVVNRVSFQRTHALEDVIEAHLEDISMDEEYTAVCGITEGEMQKSFMPEIDSMAKNMA